MGLSVELQCLLQTFFSQNALHESNLRAVLAELLKLPPSDITRQVVNENIDKINQDISDLDFEIRRTIQQADCSDIWVLCNTTSDSLTQLATMHTPHEIAYFKALLNCIFIKNNTKRAEVLAVAKMEAVREANEVNLTKAQAEVALDQFVSETWLQRSQAHYFSLTARSLIELQGYLKDTFNDNEDGTIALKSCYACKEFITQGYRCPDINCVCRFHVKCYEGYFSGPQKRCPICKDGSWKRSDVGQVGEKAATAKALLVTSDTAYGTETQLHTDEEEQEEEEVMVEVSDD